jgi:hypothetical protein
MKLRISIDMLLISGMLLSIGLILLGRVSEEGIKFVAVIGSINFILFFLRDIIKE